MQEIEIEFKNLLTRDEYEHLLHTYKVSTSDIKRQTNYYFETKDLALKEAGCALRIRKKGSSYVLTLKQPHNDGLLETHQVLSDDQFYRAIKDAEFPDGQVVTQLTDILANNPSFIYLGELSTDRVEIQLPQGLLVFDKSYYFNVIDYELEFECTDAKKGICYFHNFLLNHGIPKRDTENKIKRFFTEKLRHGNL